MFGLYKTEDHMVHCLRIGMHTWTGSFSSQDMSEFVYISSLQSRACLQALLHELHVMAWMDNTVIFLMSWPKEDFILYH